MPAPVPSDRNPWERNAWLVQAVWLVFLVFPVLSVLTETSGVLTVAGLLLVIAFGGAYAAGSRHLYGRPRRRSGLPRRAGPASRPRVVRGAYLLGLTALAAATVPLIGAASLSFLPFLVLVSYAMFALPVAGGVAAGIVGVALATGVAIWVDPGEGTWVIVFILLSVTLMTGLMRFMTDRGEAHRQVAGELAPVAERERVARDVHDVLGHSLTVITIKAELAERLLDLDPERARADPASVDPRHRMVLAWVLREAVTNVVRHSDADACAVELAGNRLTVSDDGRGLGGRPEGNGIRGLRERVEAAGGRLALTSGPTGARHRAGGDAVTSPIRVLLADDQALVRGALAALLALESDLVVVAEVGRGDEVVEAARTSGAHVCLLDIEMPGLDGIAAAAAVREQLPGVRSLIVTTFGRPGYLRRALEAGASGFVVKDTPARQLAEAVRLVHAGLRVVDPRSPPSRSSTAPTP